MKKFTFCIVAMMVAFIYMGAFWNRYVKYEHKVKEYHKEMVNREMRIDTLEDSIMRLIDKLEIYETTWEVINGKDSTTLKMIIRLIDGFRDTEEYYYEAPKPFEYKMVA